MVLLVFSLTEPQTLRNVVELKERIDGRQNRSCPCVLVGNKNDLSHLRRVNEEEAMDAARRLGCRYFETSAASPRPGEVDAIFYDATRLAVFGSKHVPLGDSQSVGRSIKSALRWLKLFRLHQRRNDIVSPAASSEPTSQPSRAALGV